MRWLLAPFYAGLAAGLVLLLIKFSQRWWGLAGRALTASGTEVIIDILSLVDFTLLANLLLIIMLAGYENFVSRLDLDGHRDRPSWIRIVDFGDLKLKLMASIVAITAIYLLESFMSIGRLSDRELAWGVGIHMTFVFSGVLLALMDRLVGHRHHKGVAIDHAVAR